MSAAGFPFSFLAVGSFPFSLASPPLPPASYPTLVGLISIYIYIYGHVYFVPATEALLRLVTTEHVGLQLPAQWRLYLNRLACSCLSSVGSPSWTPHMGFKLRNGSFCLTLARSVGLAGSCGCTGTTIVATLHTTIEGPFLSKPNKIDMTI